MPATAEAPAIPPATPSTKPQPWRNAVMGNESGCPMCRFTGQEGAAHRCRIEFRSGFPGTPVVVRIPRGSRLTVSTLPDNVELIKGIETFGEYTPTLDPGKYRYKLVRPVDPRSDRQVWADGGEFLIGLTESQFMRLASRRPALAAGIMTSDGARWICGFVGCHQRFTSVTQAIIHEAAHAGHTLQEMLDADAAEFDETMLAVSGELADHARLKAAQRAGKPAPARQVEP